MEIARDIARILLKEEAVFLWPHDPFTWTSGIKSPVYCDNRLLISTVESRQLIIDAFVQQVRAAEVDVVAGTATAGIPWAAWIAQELRLPLIYVRSSSKDHGRQNSIEGKATAGMKTILIEDLISTGKSSIAAAKKLREAGLKLESVLSIFTYGFNETEKIFQENKLLPQSLTSFEVLAQVAYDEERLNQESLKQVLNWRTSVVFP